MPEKPVYSRSLSTGCNVFLKSRLQQVKQCEYMYVHKSYFTFLRIRKFINISIDFLNMKEWHVTWR